MFSLSTLRLAIPVLVSVGLVAARPAPHRPELKGCSGQTPHAAQFLAKTTSSISALDDRHLAKYGWTKQPDVVLESRMTTCDSVTAAHNAFVASSNEPDYRVANPVIVRADHCWLVEVPPTAKRVETIIFFYDSTLKFKTIL